MAWRALRDDRHYGAMGGAGGIFYSAKARYAADHAIAGDDFDRFLFFIGEMDAEYLEHLAENAEKARQEAEQNKGKGGEQ
jgi:hypothetical protein